MFSTRSRPKSFLFYSVRASGQSAGDVAGRPVTATALSHDLKGDGVPRLQGRLHPLQVVRRIDRMLVDRKQNIALMQVNIVRKRVRIDRNDLNSTRYLQTE